MRNLTQDLPLQEMLNSIFNRAAEKLAEEEGAKEKMKKLISFEKKEHGHMPSVKEEKDECHEGKEKMASASGWTDPTFIEKLAHSLDLISEAQIETPSRGVISQAISKLANEGTAPAVNVPGSVLMTTKAMGGEQKYKKDKPKTDDPSESENKTPLFGKTPTDGKTQLSNNLHMAPGQSSGAVPTAEYPEKGPLVNNTKTAADLAREHILMKLAGEDVMKSNITGPKNYGPLVGDGGLKVMDAEQSGEGQAGGPTSGFGNQGRSHVASNMAAINYTKKDAKGPQKTQLKEVLEEPALNRATDSKLHENLRNAGTAGVKIAAAKMALQKIASAGCTCDGKGECQYCVLQAAANSFSAEKTAQKRSDTQKLANMMGGMGGGMGGMGGGMAPMASMGAGPDGCTCDHAGECRVCKLKAALAEAQAAAKGDSGGMMAPGAEKPAGMGSPMGMG